MAEAMKRAFADRAKYMADTDFVKVPIAGLISKDYAAELRKGISLDTVGTKIPAGNPLPFVGSGGTSHLSVIDQQGNIVALTQTINFFFGSGVLVPGTGIMLNDEMDDFNPQPGTSNSVEPKKRPLSSMTPTIMLKDGKPFMSLGSPGATRIISALTQIIVNVVDFRMNVQDAIDAPRIHCMTGDIFMESRIPKATQDALDGHGAQAERAGGGGPLLRRGPGGHDRPDLGHAQGRGGSPAGRGGGRLLGVMGIWGHGCLGGSREACQQNRSPVVGEAFQPRSRAGMEPLPPGDDGHEDRVALRPC